MAISKSIDDRMKEYEFASDHRLVRRLPMVLRVDGKAFHTLLRGAEKPFDSKFISAMQATAIKLCQQIAGTRIAYTQSDEISLIVRDDSSNTTEAWLDKRIQKICSISASIAAVTFTEAYGKTAYFDARCFVMPEHEVINYLIWRQQDATRNAIQMVGQANFSHTQLHKKSCDAIQEMLFSEKGINFNDLPVHQKRGTVVRKISKPIKNDYGTFARGFWEPDLNIPIFTQDKNYAGFMTGYAKIDVDPTIQFVGINMDPTKEEVTPDVQAN